MKKFLTFVLIFLFAIGNPVLAKEKKTLKDLFKKKPMNKSFKALFTIFLGILFFIPTFTANSVDKNKLANSQLKVFQ